MNAEPATEYILIGNSFPVSLIRTKVVFEPQPLDALRAAMVGKQICSYWGHPNTLTAANRVVDADLTPATERPALQITPHGTPHLDGHVFDECWVLSPDYASHVRPQVGEELDASKISGWRVLKLTWTPPKNERAL